MTPGTIRLSMGQILDALSDQNRWFASKALNKRFEDVSYAEMLGHYILNSEVGMSVYAYEVHEPILPAGDMGQMTFADIAHGDSRNLRERSDSDPHKPVYQHRM